ncbi:hypothetical protein ACFYUJ_21135 [Streptomyces sp. NPDC004520]|uniref:hypothetical protein n=1 Tax=Streptomyces sp. NPDC004520 TaxID=3364702 RepID=UPI0036AB3DA8
MAKTIHVRGEGGAVIAMDLPLAEGIQERFDRGLIQRVNADGSPYSATPTPAAPPTDPDQDEGDDDGQEPPAPAADRPAINAPKSDWIAYVVKRGLLSAEGAANYTKADLIDMVS